MFIRIVKMKFKPELIPAFLENFEKNKEKIRGFEGCEHLQLLHDIDDPTIYFTYSFWHAQENLEQYRKSDLFKGVWSYTKTLFDAKPEAWSVEQAVVMP
ncbi:MAG: antibiotic biosynthesis monooxygenase [Bacteroidetes bacterium]|nr:MAG: antibiotic biosynthesis monooxygenase [Bacteroidota bacterium]